jgi:probable HAF family extracellular repeat protein
MVDEWFLSDTNVARLVKHQRGWAIAVTRGPGTVTLKAMRHADSGLATLVVRQPASFGIRPAVDTASIGYSVAFLAERADSTVDEWISSNTRIARVWSVYPNRVAVLPLAPGTVTIQGRRRGDSGQATLVIRPWDTPPGWEAINLLPSDGINGAATAVNESGSVVGWYWKTSRNPVFYGFIYKDGVTHKLRSLDSVSVGSYPMAVGSSGTISGTTLGYGSGQQLIWDSPEAAPRIMSDANEADVIGVNALGDVLTNHGDIGHGAIHAVLWRQAGPQDLGALTDTIWWGGEAYATAWNASEQIVGASKINRISEGRGDSYKVFHPMLWEHGVMRDLGVLAPSPCVSAPGECSWGEATDINAHGVVVGTSSAADSLFRAFVWENGAMHDLGAFPGHNTAALAINDRGQILGGLGRSYPVPDTAFVWENGHAQIVMINPVWPAHVPPQVFGPNGEVVGSMLVAGVLHGFIWQAGQLTDLGRGFAVAINGHGDIIGTRGNMPTLWRRKG